MVKNPPATRETWVQSLDWEDPLEEGMAPTAVFLPGESPWTEEPGRLQYLGSQGVGHDWATKHTTHPDCLFWLNCVPLKRYTGVLTSDPVDVTSVVK